jgi:cytochrome c oxidase subunit II
MPIRFCILLFTILLSGCALDGRQSFMDPKGEVAWIQYDLFMLTVYVTFGIFLAVGGTLLWTVWRYRERASDDPNVLPPQSHGHPLVEFALIAISVGLLVIIAIPTVRAIFYTHGMPDEPESLLGYYYKGDMADGAEDEVLTIYAYGWQWWFSFEYPQLGIVTGNELAIPKGKVVRFELRSKDVIHSFWVPKLAGKVDMIPGRNNWKWLRGDEAGYFFGQCAEYCGESHAYMQFRVEVLEEDDFAKWVEQQRQVPKPPQGESWQDFVVMAARNPEQLQDGPVVRGAALFYGRGACIQCHAIQGTPAAGLLGPDLTTVASRKSIAAGWMEHHNDDFSINAERQYDNFFRWIRESQRIKPGNLMYHVPGGMRDIELSDQDCHDLAAFMMTLRP